MLKPARNIFLISRRRPPQKMIKHRTALEILIYEFCIVLKAFLSSLNTLKWYFRSSVRRQVTFSNMWPGQSFTFLHPSTHTKKKIFISTLRNCDNDIFIWILSFRKNTFYIWTLKERNFQEARVLKSFSVAPRKYQRRLYY